MEGNQSNAAVWSNGYVLVAPADAEIPQGDAPFGPEWETVGFLSPDDGFNESINVDTTDHYAWGGVLLATSKSNFKLVKSFTALENNKVVTDLTFPGNTVEFQEDGSFEGTINVPDLQDEFKVAFVNRTGTERSGRREKRFVSAGHAMVDERGEAQESETALATRQLTVAFYGGEPDPVTDRRPLVYTWQGPIDGS
jgi:hypothetical protein